MITNDAFALTNEELERYNKWAGNIARDMGNADVESWTLNVNFSFSNWGTSIIAHCSSSADCSCRLVIRDGTA